MVENLSIIERISCKMFYSLTYVKECTTFIKFLYHITKKTNVWIVFHTNFNIGIFLVVQFNLFTLLYVVKIRRWCCHGQNDVKHFCINLHYVKQPSKTLLLFYTTHQLHQWHLIIRFSWFIWVVTGRKHKKRIKRISLRSSLIYL